MRSCMMIARDALRREDASVATIAEVIGYESDTAFSLALKRRFRQQSGPLPNRDAAPRHGRIKGKNTRYCA
jgi:AraC-like DNA-binding protein